jgi:hypothetical protein
VAGSPSQGLTTEGDSVDYAIGIATVTIAGCAVYLFLTLIGAPAMRALEATTSGAWRGAWLAVVTSALLITIIPAAAIVLAMLAAPAAAQFVLAGPELWRGLQIGAAVWTTRTALVGIPRFAVDHEIAIVSAAGALRGLTPAGRAVLEQQYRQHLFRVPPTHRDASDRLPAA